MSSTACQGVRLARQPSTSSARRHWTVKRLCADQLAAAVSARGGTAVMAPADLIDRPSGPTPSDEPYLAAARAQGANAVLTIRITPNATTTRPGLSVDLGGFGFSRGGFGTGVGISAPFGGGDASTQYAANTRVIDPNGKLLWTAGSITDVAGEVLASAAVLTSAEDAPTIVSHIVSMIYLLWVFPSN